jgi:hypothetical protein
MVRNPVQEQTGLRHPCPVITLDGNRTDEEYAQLLVQLDTELEKLNGDEDKENKRLQG